MDVVDVDVEDEDKLRQYVVVSPSEEEAAEDLPGQSQEVGKEETRTGNSLRDRVRLSQGHQTLDLRRRQHNGHHHLAPARCSSLHLRHQDVLMLDRVKLLSRAN